jgi:alpha-L-fucosidase
MTGLEVSIGERKTGRRERWKSMARTGGGLSPQQEAFKDWKFGMFIHWSLFSLPRGARTRENFAPSEFSAAEWVSLARRSGQRYMTFTTKHHEGFCLFDSKLTDHTLMHAPAKTDFVALLAEECRRQEMPLFFYFSLPDLHHTDFQPGNSHAWAQYMRFHRGQIEELSTQYGRIAGFWFDPGPHHGDDHPYDMPGTEELIRRHQPHVLIMGRDFWESERTTPVLPGPASRLDDKGEGTQVDMPAPAPDNWPFEVCDTMNERWGFSPEDNEYRSPAEYLRELIDIVGKGGNLLLNVGPTGEGRIPDEQVERLDAVGAWLARNGEAVYGTRPVEMPAQTWGHPVQKEGRVYLHILNAPEETVRVEGLPGTARSARLLDGTAIPWQASGGTLEVTLREDVRDAVDTIVVVEM